MGPIPDNVRLENIYEMPPMHSIFVPRVQPVVPPRVPPAAIPTTNAGNILRVHPTAPPRVRVPTTPSLPLQFNPTVHPNKGPYNMLKPHGQNSIPSDQPGLPPTQIPPMFIPTLKGWQRYNVSHQPTGSDVIPPEMHQMNHVVPICPYAITSWYRTAVCHLTLKEYKLNAVIDETTGNAMEYKDLIKSGKHKKTWSHSCANKSGCLVH
eukprot:12438063-Ditylum_brightwellii.AAC.1